MDIPMDEQMDTETDSPQSHTSPTITTSTKPLKIRKKPGRKPNPASPAVRKAQNRAAQRAFRERKELHMKELEVDTKRLVQERDQYYKESQQLSKENNILKCENWYLKGIVLSLQLVCFKSKLRIPRHTPHIDERAQQVMSNNTPPSIAVHLNGDSHQPTPPSSNNNTNNTSNNNFNTNDSGGDHLNENSGLSPHPDELNHRRNSRPQSNTGTTEIPHINQDSSTDSASSNNGDTEGDIQLTQPVMLNNHSETVAVSNNMAAIQALRFRLRIQSALFRENAAPISAKPSCLQLAVPHDSRIDLIPTVHMRDRMILFRDQFDLDDCLRLLINEAVFHGGNPSVAANWELPAAFFEKYWYLTTDYTMERTSQRWRQIKNMFKDDPTMAPTPSPHVPHSRSPSTASMSPVPSSAFSHQGSSFNTSNDIEPSEESHRQQQQQQQHLHDRDHSYYQHQPVTHRHHQQHQQQQQQYWPPSEHFDQQNLNINADQQEKHTTTTITTNSHLAQPPPRQPSLAPTHDDILALMTPAPSTDVGPHFSPLPQQQHQQQQARSSPSSSFTTTIHPYGNYGILPNVPNAPPPPPPPPSSIHHSDFVFHDDPAAVIQQQQQDMQNLLLQGQHHHHQQQQQQHASQPPWNQSYSFMDL